MELLGRKVDTTTPEYKRFHATTISLINKIAEREARRLEGKNSPGVANKDSAKKKPSLAG